MPFIVAACLVGVMLRRRSRGRARNFSAPGPAARTASETVVLITPGDRAARRSPQQLGRRGRRRKSRCLFAIGVRLRRGTASALKAGEYRDSRRRQHGRHHGYPDRGQIDPAQDHRRRGPDQRDDLRASCNADPVLDRRCGCGAGRRHAAAGDLSLHARHHARARWSRAWKRRRANCWRSCGPRAPPDLPFKTQAGGDHARLHRGEGNRAARRAPPHRRRVRQSAAPRHEAAIRSDDHLRDHRAAIRSAAASARASSSGRRPTTPM